jgi:FkbM family methyltransferase
MSLRIKLIQLLLNANERMIFYPRLAKFYKSAISITNPVIIDVGANKGQTIRFFLRLFPQAIIYAFEPNQKLFQKLQSEFGSNANIHLFNKGVSNQTGKLVLKETVTDETSTFEELNYNSSYLKMKAKVLGIQPEEVVAAQYEVAVITLNEFIGQMIPGKIDVLKIDTEGHEMKCLQGLFDGAERAVDFIQLEHHYDDMYQHAVKDGEITGFLEEKNYGLHATVKHGFGDFDELIFKKR